MKRHCTALSEGLGDRSIRTVTIRDMIEWIRHPRACVALAAVTAEDFRTNPGPARYFDTVEPEED